MDVRGGGDADIDLPVSEQIKFVYRVGIHRVGHRHDNPVVADELKRQEVEARSHILRDERQSLLLRTHLYERDGLKVQLRAESLREVVLRQISLFYQDLPEAEVRDLLLRERGVKIFLRYHAGVEQKLSEPYDLYLLAGHCAAPLLVKADIRHVEHFGGAGRDVQDIGDGDEGHLRLYMF